MIKEKPYTHFPLGADIWGIASTHFVPDTKIFSAGERWVYVASKNGEEVAREDTLLDLLKQIAARTNTSLAQVENLYTAHFSPMSVIQLVD